VAERVVISGLGVCSPLGQGVSDNWENLSRLSFQPGQTERSNASFNQVKRAKEMAFQVAEEALRDAGLWKDGAISGVAPQRFGCTVSASKPLFASPGLRRPLPEGEGWGEAALTVFPADYINHWVCRKFNLQGEARNVVAACATGVLAIALGSSWIEHGMCDAVLAGSVEPFPHELIQAGFCQMGVTSADGFTRPFDRRRSGFTFGEGAGAVVLESESSARRRGARVRERLAGWAMGSDAHSPVAFNSNGQRIADVMGRALAKSGLTRREIGHVNAHGTATRLNDRIETQALEKAFGDHAKHLMISATKASTGHLLGAAGSAEFVFAALALRHQFVPPTVTLEEPDPDCALDFTPRRGHGASFDHAISLSFGFGGPIGALVVSRC
jgi:3-oxoacyl-[acyl-carrier-protein] synthase II